MFDFAWTEIGLIAVVALILIGPKDMPVAIKTVSGMLKKARRMASEFQVHVDEMVREANLHEVREGIQGIRNLDIKGKILNAVDGDGTIRSGMTSPFVTTPTPPPLPPALPTIEVSEHAAHVIEMPEPEPAFGDRVDGIGEVRAPAFIPPHIAHAAPPPAFIPPGTERRV